MKQISVGTGFVLALTTEGRVWLWGKLPYGRVHFDDAVMAPAEVPGLNQVMTVVAAQVAAVLKQDGTVWVWRKNEQAQFGNGRTRKEQAIPKIAGVRAVFAAGNNTYAIRDDSSLWILGVGSEFAREWSMKANAPVPIRLTISAGIVKS